jgi:hypothetical protein
MASYRGISPVEAVQGAAIQPPSFVPQIANLGNIMDTMMQRRMALAEMQRKEESDRAKDAYYRGRNAIADRRAAQDRANALAKHKAEQLRAITKDPLSGPILWPDAEGNLHVVHPRYEEFDLEGAPAPEPSPTGQPPVQEQAQMGPAPTAPPQGGTPADMAQALGIPPMAFGARPNMPGVPTFMGRPLMLPPMASATPEGQVQLSPEAQSLEPPPAAPGNNVHTDITPPAGQTSFVDEVDEDTARLLSGQDEMQTEEIPARGLPPGAREGQRYMSEDVGRGGRRGSPFAEPVPTEPMPQPERQEIPPGGLNLGGESSLVHVPPTEVRGQRFEGGGEPPKRRGRRVIFDLPGEEPLIFDLSQREAAQRAEDEARLAAIDQVLGDPRIRPEEKQVLAFEKTSILMRLNKASKALLSGRIGKLEQIGATGEEARKTEGVKQEGRVQIQGMKGEQAKEVAMIRARKGRGGKGGGMGRLGKWAEMSGSAFQALFAVNPREANRLQGRVETTIQNDLRNMNWNMLEGKGIDRLDMAMRTIQAGGTGEFEAMMNFFGYIRGGVPAENETREWHRMTDNSLRWLDKWGQKMGIGSVGTLIFGKDTYVDDNGTLQFVDEKRKEELRSKVSGLTPGHHEEMVEAIKAAQDGIRYFAKKGIDSIVSHFSLSPWATRAHKELAQGKIDQLRVFASLPEKDDLGVKAALGGQAGGPSTAPASATTITGVPEGASPALLQGLQDIIKSRTGGQ